MSVQKTNRVRWTTSGMNRLWQWSMLTILGLVLSGVAVPSVYGQGGSREVASTNRHATMHGTLSWTNTSISLSSAAVRDFPRRGAPSYTCVYLSWRGTHYNNKPMGCAGDGETQNVNGTFTTKKRPSQPRVTVCTRFGDQWECGRAS